VLRSEDDDEHYAARPAPPGPMHPATESFIASGHTAPQFDAPESENASESVTASDDGSTDDVDAAVAR